MPLMMALISDGDWTGLQTALYVVAAIVCGNIPFLLTLRARRENGFATAWDLASGTRVVVKPTGTVRPSIEPTAQPEAPPEGAASLGLYRIIQEMVPGKWIVATDPVLRRQVWLLRRHTLKLSLGRRNLVRSGRLRWLQTVETADGNWDALEASRGVPFSSVVENGKRVPWGTLRHWLHDVASELWEATRDQTLPVELSLDHVWLTARGHAVLLDEPWPGAKTRAERIPVGDLAGQQRFLNAIAAGVESTSRPLHATRVLQNLEDGKFEKLSYLTGVLRGLLNNPAEVSKGIRAGSTFMLPFYVWVLVLVGSSQGEGPVLEAMGDSVAWLALNTALLVLVCSALIQFLELPFRTTFGYSIFGLVVVDAKGERANRAQLIGRWAIASLPLSLPMLFVAQLLNTTDVVAFISALLLLLLWISAAVYAAIHPNRGLHDRLAGTWVVRR